MTLHALLSKCSLISHELSHRKEAAARGLHPPQVRIASFDLVHALRKAIEPKTGCRDRLALRRILTSVQEDETAVKAAVAKIPQAFILPILVELKFFAKVLIL